MFFFLHFVYVRKKDSFWSLKVNFGGIRIQINTRFFVKTLKRVTKSFNIPFIAQHGKL